MTQIEVMQVESNVPIPVRRVWPLRTMEVGESFVFPIEKRQSIMTTISTIKRESDKGFTTKKINDEQCRVWRTK